MSRQKTQDRSIQRQAAEPVNTSRRHAGVRADVRNRRGLVENPLAEASAFGDGGGHPFVRARETSLIRGGIVVGPTHSVRDGITHPGSGRVPVAITYSRRRSKLE
ncbi:MAG: hypothetical protein Q7S22_05495 [Candidatus Micrarchaeota archaeon]|nr:hypothetical protein [Candidatus Micrarchaeota archaeon]